MPIAPERFILEHSSLLLTAYRTCAQPYNVTYEEFSLALARHLLRAHPDVEPAKWAAEALAQVNSDDLCMALACALGDQSAWNDFVLQYRPFMIAAARGYCQSEADAHELAESAYAELYGLRPSGSEKRESKFRSYSGRGSLRGWLRAVLYQMSIDRYRERAKLTQPDTDVDWESQHIGFQPLAAQRSVYQPFVRERYQTSVRDALETAFGELERKDRLLLNYYYFDQLNLREIARLFQVHETTVARSLKRIHKRVRVTVESALRHQFRLNRAEIQECCEQVVEQLDVSLQTILLSGVPDKCG